MKFQLNKRFLPTVWALGVVTLLAVSSLYAAQPTIGPEGGDVRTFAYDPQNPDHILLSTSTGQMYSSIDNGKTWSRFARIGESSDYVLDHIYFHPSDSRIIYVAAWSVNGENGELFRSEDGGRSWQSLRQMKGKSIRSLAIAPSNPQMLVAGALDGVYRSNDGGHNWARISTEQIHNVQSLAIDPKDSNVIYAGTWRLAFKTSDGGESWTKLAKGMDEDSDVFSIAIDPKTPATVYASACTGVYKSVNGGQIFRKVEAIPVNSRRVRVIKEDPSNRSVIYAGSTTGLWKSVNSGLTWRRVSAANLIINDVMIDPRNSKRVLLATDRSGVMASSDGGLTFLSSNNGFAHRQIRAVLVDKSQNETMYAGVVNDKSFGGAFMSADNGAHWSQLSRGLNGSDVFALAQDGNGQLVAGTNTGIYRMDAATRTWSNVFTTAAWRPDVTDLRIDGENWFAGSTSGLLYSHDNGRSWQVQRNTGKEPIAIVRSSANRIAAAGYRTIMTSSDGRSFAQMPAPSVSVITGMLLDQDSALWVSSPEGLFREKSVGGWESVKTNLPDHSIKALTYDQRTRRMYAVVDSSNEVFASNDGRHWTSVYESGYQVQELVPAGNNLLVVTKYDGIINSDASDLNAKLSANITK
ncbi:MAG TPA: transcriptional regulator [Terriglobales bacterium]|nr:transcriptional regulator [Terriglobales bacterium]